MIFSRNCPKNYSPNSLFQKPRYWENNSLEHLRLTLDERLALINHIIDRINKPIKEIRLLCKLWRLFMAKFIYYLQSFIRPDLD